jgi:hypothetical protein
MYKIDTFMENYKLHGELVAMYNIDTFMENYKLHGFKGEFQNCLICQILLNKRSTNVFGLKNLDLTIILGAL